MDERPAQDTRASLVGALLALLAGLIVWLWPIGFGGRMPVGGDVTQFSLGLMAVFARSIRVGQLPIWNDLWGYGFPGLAESQMGVYYPPHLLLYGLLPLEAAYTASLVAHTLWAGMGAFWAARRFGVSPAGSALTGFSWASSGFFVIHLPHQWAYTVGSWMPWAWGLTWVLVSGRGTRRTPLLLALVLTLQVLPGHFQLAFCTEVGVFLLSLAAVVESGLRRAGAWRGILAVTLAMLAVAPLGAMQLGPSLRLARLAESQRDYEYLSGFASTPVHLISYVAPALFHVSPLWRPVAWDPFRTSPEEHLAYIGVVPLFLAMGVLIRQFRHEPATRVLSVLALATLVLSLGPWVPGFAHLIRVPGFSFFRAPARWSLATELALSLLAGRGFDALRTWPRPGWALARFAVVAALLTGAVIAMLELALASTDRLGWPPVEHLFADAARHIPWPDQGKPAPEFRTWMDEARKHQNDLRVQSALARLGMRDIPGAGLRLDRERRSIYARELGGTSALLLALLAVSSLEERRRWLKVALVALTAIDLWGLSRQRHYDLGPVRPLTAQSPVLARLAREPRGSRTVDPAQNLTMVAGAAPLQAYRTLDLPAMRWLTSGVWLDPLDRETQPQLLEVLRATGTSLRVLTRSERLPPESDLPGWSSRLTIHDPALAGWLNGTDWVAGQGVRATTFTLWRPQPFASRAWLVPLTSNRSPTILETATGEPDAVLRVLRSAKPLAVHVRRPERLDVTVEAVGPAAVVVTQLADPQWQGRWIGADGSDRPATIAPVFVLRGEHGWQAITTPGPGRWTLQLEYVAYDVQAGLLVSAVSFLILIGLGVVLRSDRPPVKAD